MLTTYSIRKSKKAKNISVHIMPHRGLEVVIPFERKRYNIEAILKTHEKWIEKNIQKYLKPTETVESIPQLPSVIFFKALDKEIQVNYQNSINKNIKIKPITENCLQIIGIHDETKIVKALKRWLMLQAQDCLIPWLQALSVKTGLPIKAVSIRRQSTLWGSCSASHKISLNAKLLFLPAKLVQYVLLHELCHTVHLNHSNHFWKLLTQFDPDCLHHRYMLRKASHHVPRWAEI